MSATDLAYAAGIFDGEGSVGIKVHQGVHGPIHSPYATVSQTRPQVLHWLVERFGGSLRFNKSGGKYGIWTWWLSARLAINFLKEIQPYSIVKREEIRITLKAFESVTPNRKLGVPLDIRQLREERRLRLKEIRRA